MKQTYILVVLLAAAAISCSKTEIDGATENDLVIDLMTQSAKDVQTRGQRYNEVSEFESQTFGLYGWNTSQSDKVLCTNEKVSYTDEKWKPQTTFKLNGTDNYVLEAVYPQPAATLGTVGLTALTTTPDPTKLTFSYKVPTATNATEDKDFMLAYYNGKSTDGTVPLTFTHPLTCVNFVKGSMIGVTSINSITLKGVYESGTCTVRATTDASKNQIYSYEKSDSDNTSLWTPAGSTTVTGASSITPSELKTDTWTYNFLLIPQNTATQEVKMTINITEGSNTYDVETTINSGYWRAGFTTTYAITFDVEYNLILEPITVTPWDETTKHKTEFDSEDGSLSGLFSVSDTKKVYFSKGSLYYNGSTFEFEDNQYSFASSWSTTHVSHFRWAANSGSLSNDISSAISTETKLSGTETDVIFTNATATTPRADFTVAGQTGVWRTLSGGNNEEWEYLINSRSGDKAPDIGEQIDARYAAVKVNEICGMLVFPDIFTWPADVSAKPSTFNEKVSDWNNVNYEIDDFAKLESAGCMFLPGAGYRGGTVIKFSVVEGYYWTSSAYSTSSAWSPFFVNNSRYWGFTVRLVKDYEEEMPDYIDDNGDNHGKGIKIGDVIWAPVNCGTDEDHPWGLLYQWGRKDGLGYNDGSTYTSETAPSIAEVFEGTNGVYTGENPLDANTLYTFATGDGMNFYYDWIKNGSNLFWNKASSPNDAAQSGKITPEKGNFDPCPDGWRIPTNYELKALLGSHKSGDLQKGNHGTLTNVDGLYFDGSTSTTPTSGVFLPAAGGTDLDGNFQMRGTDGHYWSSSVRDDSGRCMFFFDDNATMDSLHRTFGMSIRCVYDK